MGFENVGIIARLGNHNVAEAVLLVESFLRAQGVVLLAEQASQEMLAGPADAVLSRDKLGAQCDLIVVVGGDGSLLGVARDLAATGTPVIGVNRGGLGFLAGVAPDQIAQQLGEVLAGQYVANHRFLLEARVIRDGVDVGGSCALNDVVVHAGTMSRMMDFSLVIDDTFVYEQRSDGLIISSPTGSTAYALSAGGPIMHPNLDAVVIVPMFPHTLTSRPLMVPGDSHIEVIVGTTDSTNPQVSCDSQVDIPVEMDDRVQIRKYPHQLELLYPVEHSFYESCRSKLDWASRLGGAKVPKEAHDKG